jgi:glycerol-3-phosphate cytidylyltransferase-like family protein
MVYKSIDVIVVLGAGFERVRERIKGAKSVYELTKIKEGNPVIIFSGYDVRERDVRKLVEELRKRGIEQL